ncbi:MAG: hypothetical protein H7843_16145, partial [Nitrospirota bacterium]
MKYDINRPDKETEDEKEKYLLKLYVTGNTLLSMRAIDNITGLCEEHFKGQYKLNIVDIYHRTSLAWRERIVATPMLLRDCLTNCVNPKKAKGGEAVWYECVSP